jgi:hypothetical protein
VRTQHTRPSSIAGLLFLLQALVPSAQADLVVNDPRFTPILRGSGFQSYPLTVDSQGAIYTVTGTSVSDRLLKVNTDGTVVTVNPSVGSVIGTAGKMTFGFGGDLYATSGFPGYPSGIREFALPSGSASMFYSDSTFQGDAGIVFDSKNQSLWISNFGPTRNDIAEIDASGNVIQTISNVSFGGYGLALDPSGNLLVFSNNVLTRIDPVTHDVTPIADLSYLNPPGKAFTSLALDPSTGDLYFSSIADVYRIAEDGTGLDLVATGTNGVSQVAIGLSGDGSGRTSVYVSDPGDYRLYELRPVPEPNTFLIALVAALCFVGYGCRVT